MQRRCTIKNCDVPTSNIKANTNPMFILNIEWKVVPCWVVIWITFCGKNIPQYSREIILLFISTLTKLGIVPNNCGDNFCFKTMKRISFTDTAIPETLTTLIQQCSISVKQKPFVAKLEKFFFKKKFKILTNSCLDLMTVSQTSFPYQTYHPIRK